MRVRKGTKATAAAATAAAVEQGNKTSPSAAAGVFTEAQVEQIVARMVERFSGAQHRVAPVNLATGDREPPPLETVNISASGETSAEHEPIEVISGPDAIRQMETAAFMNEMVEVVVEMSDKDGAALFVYAGHNGNDQYLQRDQPQAIKRRFLYSMLQARTRVGKCEFGRAPNGGEYNRLKFMASPTHSVRVLRDTKKGDAWLNYQLTHA